MSRKNTIIHNARFVIRRAALNEISKIAPVMAMAWMNMLHVPDGAERKIATLDQVCAAFRRLGKEGMIQRVRSSESAWLDLWEII